MPVADPHLEPGARAATGLLRVARPGQDAQIARGGAGIVGKARARHLAAAGAMAALQKANGPFDAEAKVTA
jgi:hypothetical protein